MIAKVKDLLRDTHGASAIEFAIVIFPLLGLLIFMIQAFVIFMANEALDTFAEDTARSMMTGATQNLALTTATFQTKVCATLPSLFSCSRLWVDVQNVSTFATVDLSSPTVTVDGSGNVTSGWNYNPGTQSAIVVIRMVYMVPVVGLPIGSLANLGSTIHRIAATSVLKTETYQ